ncbi:carbon-nitrogen hydrolase family protein [Aestuariirhabdus sp. Z084]|uniref:carbon-nitrogen hydrolase family protein n=1 Tax=Aestuariirhabdus haliotis TaxID=2918751 RepID=UPI00201B3EF7|nr:carbon-nitrogen hydrolase family protein [Aestuariirhabdus haliotis]MCL6415218.1 carbon-nitrogen hydrolase family protein [Aestuariirhabdus haliotis]MCL6419478.1 carbon-nitrogen hydrolase family protein [Aestuariirhabdus haliotis]
MQRCRIALAQMNSVADLKENLDNAERLIIEAGHQGADLIVLPECFASFGGGSVAEVAKTIEQAGVIARLSSLSARHGVWLVAGTLPMVEDGNPDIRAFSRCLVFDSQGREVSYYDKVHLFDVDVADTTGRYRESSDYQPGQHLSLIDTPWGKLAPLVCYDLRFPELFKALALNGAEIICLPSAFTAVTGQAHWEPLIRARAIENALYVLAVNQCGQTGSRKTWGHSMVVDPWGEICACAGDDVELVLVDLRPDTLVKARESIPSLNHHKLATGWYPLPVRTNDPNGS